MFGDMAEKKVGLESLLSRERDQERNYEWLAAAETNEELLASSGDQGAVEKGDALERLGYSLSRAALQAEDKDEFRRRIEKSLETYGRALETFHTSSLPVAQARATRCLAMSEYLRFWLESEVGAKRQRIVSAWKNAKDAIEAFLELKQFQDLVKSCYDMYFAAVLSLHFETDAVKRASILKDLEKYVIEASHHVSEPRHVAQNLVQRASCLQASIGLLSVTIDLALQRTLECREDWRKAVDADEESAVLEIAKADLLAGVDWAFGPDNILRVSEKELEYAKKTNDRLILGMAKGQRAVYLSWYATGTEDPDKFKAAADEIQRLTEGARREFEPISFVGPDFFGALWASAPSAPWFSVATSMREMDPAKKRVHAEEGLKRAREQFAFAERSQYPYAITSAHFILGIALLEDAKCETNNNSKQFLLRESVEHKKRAIEGEDDFLLSHFWNRGVVRCQLAETEFELARMVENDERMTVLHTAASRMGEGLDLCTIWYAYPSGQEFYDSTNFAALGTYWLDYGKILRFCREVGGDDEDLRAATRAFEKAAEFQTKADMQGRVAESWWEAAQTFELLGEHAKASEEFLLASECYNKAAEKIPQLMGFYTEHSSYMRAWSEIEKAVHHHMKQEPASAKEHYNKAAELHESTGKWSFLASNYFAWAQVENAEDLSQSEKCKESIDAFREAARLFKDSKSKMREQLAKIEVNDEKQMVERLVDAADNRQELCKARIALEEARLLDKEGSLGSASEKYGIAVAMFAKIKQGTADEENRREIELIATLTKAWKAMAKAEAESSADLYEEAARLFDEAKNLSPGDKAKNLAMGHSRFCRALQAGVFFSDTGDLAQHDTATNNLESAAKYYLKAGLENASEYARASKLLFDAYAQMNRASKEPDHEKKAKFYISAEKILQASASSYEKANQPGKQEQVLKLLVKVQQDKELAVSLTEVFRAPDIVSTTMAFSSPTPTHETAVGLDRFEHADIQATLIVGPKDLLVGEDFNLGIELVNAGRGPAQLIKLHDPVPKGFTLREEPEGYRMEDSYLNLRGKRLDPLKTEEIDLVLKPTHRGQFALKPRILYLDESGKYKSHEPEPIKVSVGIEPTAPADKAVHLDTREAAEARSLLAGLNVVTLSHYRIVGNYVRYGNAVCNALKDARQKLVAACRSSSPKRENYIIWAPPGSGKTYFVQEVAASLGDSVHYRELNLAKLDEAGFRSGLGELRGAQKPCLCLVDEVDAKPDASWPYEALMPFLDASATEGARFVFVLAGSSGSNLEEMKKSITSRPKGSDILSRVPTDNEYSIPPMGVGDRMLVVLSQFRQAGRQMAREVREVEKLGLYYVALNPRLSNARQLREFAVRCAERVLPGDDRLKYVSLFHPGDLENKLFWTQALQSARALVGSFLLVED